MNAITDYMIVMRMLNAVTLMVAMSVHVKLDMLEMGLFVKVNTLHGVYFVNPPASILL